MDLEDIKIDTNNCVDYYEPNEKYLVQIEKKDHIPKNKQTFDPVVPMPAKYLIIRDEQSFDLFTDKYGYLRKAIPDDATGSQILGIKWTKVRKDFGGIKLEYSQLVDRFFMAPFKGKQYSSWYDEEHYTDGKFL